MSRLILFAFADSSCEHYNAFLGNVANDITPILRPNSAIVTGLDRVKRQGALQMLSGSTSFLLGRSEHSCTSSSVNGKLDFIIIKIFK